MPDQSDKAKDKADKANRDTAASPPLTAEEKAKARDYEIIVSLDIKRTVNGTKQDYFKSASTYSNVDYGLVVVFEQTMMDMAKKFGDMGIIAAHVKGLGDRIEKFNIKLSDDDEDDKPGRDGR